MMITSVKDIKDKNDLEIYICIIIGDKLKIFVVNVKWTILDSDNKYIFK